MVKAKVKTIKTGLGITAAFVTANAGARQVEEIMPASKKHKVSTSIESLSNTMFVDEENNNIQVPLIDLYKQVFPDNFSKDSVPLGYQVEVYQPYQNENENERKERLTLEDNVSIPVGGSAVVYFHEQYTPYSGNKFRVASLVSGGPDAVVLASLLNQSAGEKFIAKDMYYIIPGRPSDQHELDSVYHFSKTLGWNVHTIDLSAQRVRLLPCGASEPTFIHYGLSSALSLVSAHSQRKGGHDLIFLGLHAADAHYKARDSREYTRNFIDKWNNMWTQFYPKSAKVHTPFIDSFDKVDILHLGKALNVDLHKTWSCYEGKQYHCGRCKSCLERRLAFTVAQIDDKTKYETEFNISHTKKEHLLKAISLEAV